MAEKQIVAADPRVRLATAIRGWIHMDNLAETHNRQAMNARSLRAKHEADAIALMKDMRLDKTTIQVSGASLQMAKRRASEPLTWTYLEREAAAWGSAAHLSPTQIQGLVKWLQEHREVKETEYIKKMTGSDASGPSV
jgi:hypothetical protein